MILWAGGGSGVCAGLVVGADVKTESRRAFEKSPEVEQLSYRQALSSYGHSVTRKSIYGCRTSFETSSVAKGRDKRPRCGGNKRLDFRPATLTLKPFRPVIVPCSWYDPEKNFLQFPIPSPFARHAVSSRDRL